MSRTTLPFLIALALLCAPISALAQDRFYFRVTTAAVTSEGTVTPPSVDPGLPPPISNGGPPAGPGTPGMGGISYQLVTFAALPGWRYSIPWQSAPTLSGIEIVGSGVDAQIALSVTSGGCSRGSVLIGVATGSIGYEGYATGSCEPFGPDVWETISGRPMPGSVSIVATGALPVSGGPTCWTLQGVH